MQCEERTLHLATLRRCCFSFTGKQPKPPKKNFKKVSYERKKYVPFGDYIYNRFPMKMRVVLILLLLIVFSVSAFAEADTTLIKPVINQTEIYYSFNEDSSILLLEVVIYQGCFYKENVLILCRRLEKKMNTFTGTHSEKKETSIFSFIGKTAVTLKKYELANHLGNVCVVVSDKKIPIAKQDGKFDYWKADVLSASDYYPFGMLMPGRNFKSDGYRFGFNGYEMDNEMRGKTGADYDFDGYGLDVLLGRRKTLDPKFKDYPYLSPYAVFKNNPLYFIDKNGEFTIGVHKKITEQALLRANLPITKVDEDDVYGEKTNSVIHGVQRADYLGFASDLHFDSKSTFKEINETWSELGEKIAKTDYSFNKGGLGVALHTVQDFYSHSNYVELYIDYFKSKGGDISKLKPGDIPIYDEKTKDSDFGKYLDKQNSLETGKFNFFRWIVG